MKKNILLLCCCCLICFRMMAGNITGIEKLVTKEIMIDKQFKRLIVAPHINVVLVADGAADQLIISGELQWITLIDVHISNSELVITAKKNLKGKKVTVYVPYRDLSAITLQKGACLSGEGKLNFTTLNIVINIGSQVNLDATGKITLLSADDCEIVYAREETTTVVTKYR